MSAAGRKGIAALILAMSMAFPASANRWKEVAKGDGYTSEAGTIRASQSKQPAEKVLSVAKAFTGLPYVWAGHDPTSGFDCSGYVYEVLRLNGYEVPRMADEQFDQTKRVAYKDLAPGDLVFFHTYLPGPSHVGFYLGKGDFIHASSAAEGVVVSNLTSGYYRERFLGGGRPDGWQGQPLRVAKLVEPVSEVTEVATVEAVAEVKQAAPELVVKPDLSNSPFSRNRGPQPVRVSVVPEPENAAEVAVEDWTLVLGETVAVARLQMEALARSFSTALGLPG